MNCLHGPKPAPVRHLGAAPLRQTSRRSGLPQKADHRWRAALVAETEPQAKKLSGFEPERQFRALYEVGELLGEAYRLSSAQSALLGLTWSGRSHY